MNSTKKTIYHFHSLARAISVPIALVLLNVLIAPLTLRWDLTQNRQYTLGEATRRVLRELSNPITVKVFFSSELPQEFVAIRQDVMDVVGEYQRIGLVKVIVETADPKTDPAAASEAAQLGVPEVQFNTRSVKKFEISSGYAGLAIRYLENSLPLPVINATTNLEYDLTLAIRRISRERQPRIGFITGHGEQLDPNVRQALAREYDVSELTLAAGAPTPKTYAGLLIVGPTDTFPPTELLALDQYVMNGGTLVVLADGVTVDEQTLQANVNPQNLNDILSAYGVTINADIVADPQLGELLWFTANGRQVLTPYPLWPQVIQTVRTRWSGLHPDHPITSKLNSLTLPWPSSLALREDPTVQTTILGQSSPASFTLDADSAPLYLSPQAIQAPADGRTAQHVVAALQQGKLKSAFSGKPLPADADISADQMKTESDHATVLVIGNSRFLNGQLLDLARQAPENLALLGNSLDALVQDASLIAIRSRSAVQRPLKSVTDGTAAWISWGNTIGGAMAVVIMGLVVIFVRKQVTRRAIRRYSGTTGAEM